MKKSKPKKIYEHLPFKPGVYLFKDKSGNVLYIGKAINLKKRVKNYYSENKVNIRTENLLNQTIKADFITTNTEIESLLLEARLIKQYRPKYNVRLKDDKRYLYVGITKQKYPAVRLIRQPEKELKLLDWFGPFPTSQSIREVLRLLRRIFPFCTCGKMPKSCFYSHLNLCPGKDENQLKDYQQTIKSIRLFLAGQISPLIKDLKKKMEKSAKNLEFEEAATYKRQIQMIENLMLGFKRFPEGEKPKKQLKSLRRLLVRWQGIDPVVIHRLEAFDVANLGRKIIVGAMAVFNEGEPEKVSYRQFRLKKPFLGDPEALKEILLRRFNHPEWIYPQLILVDGGKGQVRAVFQALKKRGMAKQIALLGLAKKQEIIVVPRVQKGKISGWKRLSYAAGSGVLQLLQYARDEAHRFSQRYYHTLYRKTTLVSSGPK